MPSTSLSHVQIFPRNSETRWSRRKVSKIRIQPANDPRVSRNVGIDVRSLNRETVLKMDRSRIRSTTGCVLCTVACSTYVRLKIWDTATRFDSRRLIKHSEASRRYELDATTHACASIITELVINLNQPSSQDNAIPRVNSTNKLFIRIHFLSPFFLFFFALIMTMHASVSRWMYRALRNKPLERLLICSWTGVECGTTFVYIDAQSEWIGRINKASVPMNIVLLYRYGW